MPKRATKAGLAKTLKAVQAWQANGMVHPLTCGNDSQHAPLEPAIEGDAVVLRCSDCDYRQTFIPPIVKAHKARKRRRPIMVPPIGVDFEEAVSRLLRVKPPARKAGKTR